MTEILSGKSMITVENFQKALHEINTEVTVPCKLCGNPTRYVKIKTCDLCWEMEKGIESFIRIDKKKAKEWLLEQLKSLE